jgi:hypothetical protein
MIEDTRPSHAANVQLYRWYQFYERDIFDETRLNNQLDILDENIFIKSAAGEHTGRNGYPARLKAYKGWQNAHHVQNSSVVVNEDGTIALEADILYQNIKPDESEDIYTIHYTTQLKKYDNQALPVFSNIEIQPTGFPEKKAFEDAYPTNRAKSLMYNWMLNMEQLDGNVEPFKEMLTEDFVLNFSTTTPLSSIEELNIWLNGAPLGLKQSSHFPENFSIKTT